MKIMALMVVVLVVLASVVNAVTLNSVSNHVDVASNMNGQLTFWFANNEQPATASYAVNTQGNIVSSVSPATGTISTGATKSFVVTFSPSICSQGTFYATVNLDVAVNGVVQRISKVIEVTVRRAADCTTVINGVPVTNGVSDSSNAYSGSSVSLSPTFDPSEENIVIHTVEGKTDVANSELVQLNVDVVNRGSPGLVTISAFANPAMAAMLSDNSFVLQRSEAKRLTLYVKPTDLVGRQFVSLQVVKSGRVISTKEIFFDVANTHSVELQMPQTINTNNCGVVTIAGTVVNKGSAAETATVSIPALLSSSNGFAIAPRSVKQFVLNVDLSRVQSGTHLVEFKLSNNAVSSSSVVKMNVAECPETAALVYSIVVSNTGNETMRGVTVSVADIPANWVVATPVAVDIAPNQTANLTVTVKPTGEWNNEIVPMLIAKDVTGKVVKTQKAEPVKPRTATGLFLAGLFGFNGLQWIAGILFAALIFAIFSAKATLRRSAA